MAYNAAAGYPLSIHVHHHRLCLLSGAPTTHLQITVPINISHFLRAERKPIIVPRNTMHQRLGPYDHPWTILALQLQQSRS